MKLGLDRDWDAFSCHFPRGFKWPRPWNQILKSGLERQSTGGKLWENYGKPGKTMENYGSFHVLLLFLFIVFLYVLFFLFSISHPFPSPFSKIKDIWRLYLSFSKKRQSFLLISFDKDHRGHCLQYKSS